MGDLKPVDDLKIRIEPVELPSINEYDELKDMCLEYMEFLASGDYHEDNDWRHWVYEAAMKFVYGEKVFDEVNRLINVQSKRWMEERHRKERENLRRQQSKEFGDE